MTDPGSTSPQSRLAAALLCALFGWVGAHRFYAGKSGTALLMVLTLGGFGIWVALDLILILAGVFTDAEGRALRVWQATAEVSPEPTAALRGRVDQIDRQLTDLQGVLLEMVDKLDRRAWGRLV